MGSSRMLITIGVLVLVVVARVDAEILRVDLNGIDAARFKCRLGGDFPVGDETQRRKTVAIGTRGKEARFLTVIEPFEAERRVKRALDLASIWH